MNLFSAIAARATDESAEREGDTDRTASPSRDAQRAETRRGAYPAIGAHRAGDGAPGGDETPQLSVSDLRARPGPEFSLRVDSLTVGDSEVVALLGPSGCGKSTLLRCIAGIASTDAGEIRVGGERVAGPGVSTAPEDRDVGMVFQSYALWPHMTVRENVAFPLDHGAEVPANAREKWVDDVLATLGIADVADSPATDVSGGQQQRTALGRALVHDPELLLLDEPLSNLDEGLRAETRDELQRLHHDLGVSMLYVTHDQQEAFYLADRVVVLRDGAVVERGTPRELSRRPETAFTRSFVGGHTQFSGTVTTDGRGQPVVRTPLVDVPLANVECVADDPGGRVTCFLRPGDVTVGGFSSADDGRIEIAGTVIAEGLLGDQYELTVRPADRDATLAVHTDTDREFAPGDDITLHVRPEAIQVYPPADGAPSADGPPPTDGVPSVDETPSADGAGS